MLLNFPQVVPSDVCLACDGCCRFEHARSPWRPQIAREEQSFFVEKKGCMCPVNTADEDFPQPCYVSTKPWHAQVKCCYFQAKTHRCDIYNERPFDCQLYPFLLVKEGQQHKLGLHLSCPFVLEKRYQPSFEELIGRVKTYFQTKEMALFVQSNSQMFSAYEEHRPEIEVLDSI